jgi:putative tryptophan/tyrosine transport system substrate-binding protein
MPTIGGHKSVSNRFVIPAALALFTAQVAVGAEPAAKVYRIGVLTETRIENVQEYWQTALRQRGYIEGQNAAFEFREAAEKPELLPQLATDLVQRNVDIILTASTPPAVAAKQATTTIPIVTMSADPVGAGLVTSLAHPGGNVTGVYVPVIELAPKRLQLLKEAVPGLTRVAVLLNPNNQAARSQATATEQAGLALGIRTFSVEIRNESDLKLAFQNLAARRAQAFIVMQDPVMITLREKLAEFALINGIASSYPYRTFVDAGGLMSYGVSLTGLFELGVTYADRILKGAKPSDLPMEQPSRFEFVINLKTAEVLGIAIPQSLMIRADELIR